MRPTPSFTCIQCAVRLGCQLSFARPLHHAARLRASPAANPPVPVRPTSAPKPVIDIKHIRHNPDLHRQNCFDRNYAALADNPVRIKALFAQWKTLQSDSRRLRERGNILRRCMTNPTSVSGDEFGVAGLTHDQLLSEARNVKIELATVENAERSMVREMEMLAEALPNLTSDETPRGDEPIVLSYLNDHLGLTDQKKEADGSTTPATSSDRIWRSHAHIGTELGILDFAAAATCSGWGWYYLVGPGVQLEQALVSYALETCRLAGWKLVSPPSMVYAHIAAACGFKPRDANGETQIFTIAQDSTVNKAEHVLTGTAEIPLAAMKADTLVDPSELPLRTVAVSRCYRAEAGARGLSTKGLFRVHEFTKVELFALTPPSVASSAETWDEVIDLQSEMLGSLGLPCRMLEMPSADLGASASRKCDIEVYFPSRRDRNGGWGEVTSASICGDYQTRRLGTRIKRPDGKSAYPFSVNGTAMAVPRVLAAILEHGWDEGSMSLEVPEVLRPWMGGLERIEMERRLR